MTTMQIYYANILGILYYSNVNLLYSDFSYSFTYVMRTIFIIDVKL